GCRSDSIRIHPLGGYMQPVDIGSMPAARIDMKKTLLASLTSLVLAGAVAMPAMAQSARGEAARDGRSHSADVRGGARSGDARSSRDDRGDRRDNREERRDDRP